MVSLKKILNKILRDFTKIKNAIQVGVPSNTSLKNNYTKCSLREIRKIGSLFTFSNDEITCGESGIIEICLILYCYNGFNTSDLIHIACYKNGVMTTRLTSRVNLQGSYQTFSKTDYMEVNKGDKLSLYASNRDGNRGIIADETQMLVRYIA